MRTGNLPAEERGLVVGLGQVERRARGRAAGEGLGRDRRDGRRRGLGTGEEGPEDGDVLGKEHCDGCDVVVGEVDDEVDWKLVMFLN